MQKWWKLLGGTERI